MKEGRGEGREGGERGRERGDNRSNSLPADEASKCRSLQPSTDADAGTVRTSRLTVKKEAAVRRKKNEHMRLLFRQMGQPAPSNVSALN